MNFFSKNKNPEQKRKTEYERLLKEAMLAQRGGDIVKSADLHARADELLKQMEADGSLST